MTHQDPRSNQFRNVLAVSLQCLLLCSTPAFAHPLFLIQPVAKDAEKKENDAALGKLKHPTQQLKGVAYNDESLFCLPRSVAQIDLTFVVYSRNAPPLGVFMEAPKSSKEKGKDKDADDGDASKNYQAVANVNTRITPEQLSNLNRNSSAADAVRKQAAMLAAAGKPAAKATTKGGDSKKKSEKPEQQDASDNTKTKSTKTDPIAGHVETNTEPPSDKQSQKPADIKSIALADSASLDESSYAEVNCPFIAVIPDYATLQIKSVPDEDLQFKVVLGNLHGLVSDINKASLSKDASGVVTGIDTDFHDRTADIIADLGVTAADGASFASKFMLAKLADIPPVQPNYVQIATIKVTKVVDLVGDTSTPVDLSDVKEAIQKCIKRMGYSGKDFPGGAELSMPSLTLNYSEPLVHIKSQDIMNKEGYEGLVVREPHMIEIKLNATNNFLSPTCLAAQHEVVAQTGDIAGIKIQKKAFSKNTRAITLSTYGGVTTLSATSTSPIKEVTGALREIGDSLNGIAVPQKKK